MNKRGVIGGLSRLIAAIAALAATASGRADAAPLGAEVNNIAEVSYSIGATATALTTPPAIFTIEAARTPSTIEFLRYSPNAPDAFAARLNGAGLQSSVSGEVRPPRPFRSAGGAAINTQAPIMVTPASAYFAGEPVIIRVTDAGQNGDPAAIETVEAAIRAANGDIETLKLFESGADTGEFLAWIASAAGPVAANDSILTITRGDVITARYQDPFDPDEISTDTAGADPFGRVFDSLTGAMIDGAKVSIVDDATGLPAQVYGIDGSSAFPSTLVAGQTVTDAGGIVYNLGPGEFRFPIMVPGTYRLIVAPPAGYSAPSAAAASSFAALPNAPFTIAPGSYGRPFILDGTSDIALDFPLDPIADLVLSKRADVSTASVGDFVRYRISIENRSAAPAVARIVDDLPKGFRYQGRSARLDGAPIADPQIAADGGILTFNVGSISPGAIADLVYVVEIAAGAERGASVNRAHAISQSGIAISNRAEAAVDVADDFFRSSVTIVGRIIESGCDAKGNASAPPRKDEGLAGIRLYMETGATVVSDEYGRFHFEDVSPETHVVQVDEESLPDGYELANCADTTRSAGSARSQFVDAKGGKIWRTNFHVRRRDAALVAPSAEDEKPAFNVDREYLSYDKAWLNRQTSADPAWAYPAEGVTPSSPSLNFGLKHDARTRATLFLNGREVPQENFAGRDVSLTGSIALTRWKGVDLRGGANRFEAVLTDERGAEVARLARILDYNDDALRAIFLPDQTRAVADGKTRPTIAIRLTDGAGKPVRAGHVVAVEISPPFRAASREAIEQRAPLDAPLSASSGVPVGQDGVALIEFEPTVETGLARIKVSLDDGSEQIISAYVEPATRNWIVVGLAEGEGGLEKRGGSLKTASGSEMIGRGRVAGFAKGTVKGDWLVTIAGDSRNGRGPDDDELFDVIDPDDRYPLYGDRSNQHFEAQSRYPVYLKAEKGGFKAQFGDYDTGMTEAKLAQYSRRLSGFQTLYEGERFAFTGFAAETNQAFVKDEISADGTSGPFLLTAGPIVRNSESIHVETRDRFRPDVVIGSTTLIRYADYDIDFETGEIIFRVPVPAADAGFNPNVIVVDYETASPVDRNLTAGGRGAVRFLAGRGEVGATFIHEEAPGVSGARTNLAGADFQLNFTNEDLFRLEFASSDTSGPFLDGRNEALLAEASHTGDRLKAKAYFSRVEPSFGLSQQTSAIAGAMRYGAEGSLELAEFENEAGTQRGARLLDAKAYREENLVTGASRDLAEIALRQTSNWTSGSVGLRGVRESPQAGPKREGLFATTALQQRFETIGLSLRAAREQAISGDDASALFPTRTSIGFDQRLFEGFTLSATHEILDGDRISQSNTTVGLTSEPWEGGKITLAGDRITQDSGERIGATFGVDQQVRLSKKWTGSLGVARREDLKKEGAVDAPDDIVPDIPKSPFEETGAAFTSLYVGAGYRGDATSGSSRFEMKKTEIGQRYLISAGAARELSEQLSFAAAGRFQAENNELTPDDRRFDLRLGSSWRPNHEGLIIFNRFDVKQREIDRDSESWKAVHNLTLNAAVRERLQLALNHGFKYSALNADGVAHDGITELLGAEARYDLTDRVDIGLHAEGLYSFNARTLEYSFGPSLGFTPTENVWLSFGWNFAGFAEEDFAASEYSRAGPYLKLRIKFDQSTARGLLDAISPERVQ